MDLRFLVPWLALLPAGSLLSQPFPDLPAIYVSGHIGLFPDDDFHNHAQLSLGYQWRKWAGLGLHVGTYGEFDGYPERFRGGGMSFRAVPGRHWVARADLGFAWNYSLPNDCMCENRFVPGWYAFFNLHAGWRIGKVFTLGAGIFYIPRAVVETQWYDYDIDGHQVWEPAIRHDYSMSAFQLTLGVNLN